MPAAKFIVSGKVQGVWYRASTRDEAARLGITRGHAINLADGRVEVVAMGDAARLDALEAWLQRGPQHARVESVTRSEADEAAIPDEGFRIG